MADKVWTVEELERMSPVEQDAVFNQSLVTGTAIVPSEFLERVRKRALERIADDELHKR